MAWFEKAFGEWVVRYRWLLIITAILVLVGATSGVRYLSFNYDTRVFFSEENPQLQALEELENTYNKISNVLFVVAPKNGDVFTPEALAAVEELTEKSWRMPYSSRVNSITNFQHTRAEEDELVVEDLVPDAMSATEADLERMKRIALSEPQLVNSLVSPAGHVTGVNVNVLLPGESIEEIPEVEAFVLNLADEIRRKYSGIDLYLTGGVMIDAAFGEAGPKDMTTLVPLMFLTLIIIAGIALRSFAGTFGTLAVILMSMSTGMGLAGWGRISITTASAIAPTIIGTLAVADSVHILVTMFQQLRLGSSKHEAVAESLRINLQPVFLTSATTAIGFLTMNFSDAPPFRDLGNIVAMGVMAAFVYSVLFLPALMAVLPLRIKARAEKTEYRNCDRLASFVINRRKQVLWGTMAIIMVFAAGTLKIEFHDDWIKYFDESFDVRRATDFATANLNGYDSIEYSLDSGESGGIADPEYLAKMEDFSNWFRQQAKVIHVSSITNTMKRLNKNMHGDDEFFYRIPDQRDLAAQYLLLYEMSLPFGFDLNNQINVDKSATRMIVTLRNATTAEVRETDEKARAWLKANSPSMFTYGSGLSVIWAHISERNINNMLGASFGALVLISVILMFALRSFKLGLLSLIPNLTPAIMAFGIWGMLMGRVGLGLSVIAAMTLGIVVDDTVHFMSKYLRARREHNMDAPGAVRYSFNTVGAAMWITTIALVAGFMILALSGFKMNADTGLMAALTITLALGLDFLFLPTLLMKVEEKTDEKTKQNSEAVDDRHDAVLVSATAGGIGRDA
jgi:predicted RND superfamily exporter protein